MSKSTTASPQAGAAPKGGRKASEADEHHLVAELRQAMANRDVATIGRMIELLGTIKTELLIGEPVIDGPPAAKSDPTAGSSPATAPRTAAPQKVKPAARPQR